MAERRDKRSSLKEAVNHVEDGMRIAFGGFAIYQRPMAFVHELIRANKKDLTIVGVVNANETDMLAGAGCISHIETSYVGLEKFGIAKNFRRNVENGNIKVTEYSELLSWDRFRADQDGLTFWPVSYLGGCDILSNNSDIKPFTCPVTQKNMWAIPPANADIVVIHASTGDKYGNIQIPSHHMLPQSMNVAMSRACSNVIVTVERIVDTETLKSQPHLTLIPAFRTLSVVELAFGAHPTAVLGEYGIDEIHMDEYIKASGSQEEFRQYLNKYIVGTKDFTGYLDLIGKKRLSELKQGGEENEA